MIVILELLQKAISLKESGQLEEAKTILSDLIKQEPHNPSIWYQLAWVHDVMEQERDAIPFYLKSLDLGLLGVERQGALLGLGSTYRAIGMYQESKLVFEEAIKDYPERREFQVFYAMVLYNLNEHGHAMDILLKQLSETSNDEGIQSYKKAIFFYADKLDQLWS